VVEEFFNAFLKRRYRVAGTVLRPLCGWHVVYLEAAGCPMMRGEIPNRGELGLMVRLLGMDGETLADPAKAMRRLECRWRRAWFSVRLWLCGGYSRGLAEVCAFWKAHANFPQMLPTGAGRAEPSNVPYVLGVVVRAGGRESDWLRPLDRLVWEGVARDAEDPSKVVRVQDEEDKRLVEEALAVFAEKQRVREGVGCG